MPDSDISLSFRENINGDMGGRVFPQRVAPKDYERLRIDRLRQAVVDKLPKLQKCRPARTVLVLENRDMALSNHLVISDGLETVLDGRADVPDEVWLVDAVHQAFWTSICLRKGGVRFPYDNDPVRFRQFDPSQFAAS